MTFLKYFLLTAFILALIAILVLAFKSRKPFKFILLNAFLGLSTLLILYLTRKLTGIHITINPYTVVSASLFGVPMVILIIFLNFFVFM
ncbi:MAG: hypothetical protein E7545_06615 [Ruminococcaceae bacterium]|nr:hypothetical protein [Oscillospiraceae bacterium]